MTNALSSSLNTTLDFGFLPAFLLFELATIFCLFGKKISRGLIITLYIIEFHPYQLRKIKFFK